MMTKKPRAKKRTATKTSSRAGKTSTRFEPDPAELRAFKALDAGGPQSVPAKTYEVGQVVDVSAGDLELLQHSNLQVANAQAVLGRARAEFLEFEKRVKEHAQKFEQEEAKAMETLTQMSQEFRNLVINIGRKNHINIGDDSPERWEFKADIMKFVRTS